MFVQAPEPVGNVAHPNHYILSVQNMAQPTVKTEEVRESRPRAGSELVMASWARGCFGDRSLGTMVTVA